MRASNETQLLRFREYRAASRCPRFLWFLLHPERTGEDSSPQVDNSEKIAHIFAIKTLNYRFIEKQVEALIPNLLKIRTDAPGQVDLETRQALEKVREGGHQEESSGPREGLGQIQSTGGYEGAGQVHATGAQGGAGSEMEAAGASVFFSPGLTAGGCFARLSLLFCLSDGSYKAVTISPATKIKSKSKGRHDLAIYTFAMAGIKISQSEIWHINPHYRFEGQDRLKYLLLSGEMSRQRALFISREVDTQKAFIRAEKRLSNLRRISALDKLPPREEELCLNPYNCRFAELCKPDLKPLPANHIFTLHKGGNGSLVLYREGYLEIEDIPSRVILDQKQEIQRKAVTENKPHLEREVLESFFAKLEEPLYFLDFETVSFPLPIYKNLPPYSAYPFLYSLRKIDSLADLSCKEEGPKGGEEWVFFSKPGVDQRIEMARKLSKELGRQGSILVYDAKAERKIINSLSESDNSPESNLKEASKRLVDVHSIFTSFSFYHPNQKGRTSLKSVFPVLSNISYEDLTIRSGINAGLEYLRMSIEEEEGIGNEQYRERVRRLSAYCSRDSLAVIQILRALKGLAENPQSIPE